MARVDLRSHSGRGHWTETGVRNRLAGLAPKGLSNCEVSAQWHLLYFVATLARAWGSEMSRKNSHGLVTVAT